MNHDSMESEILDYIQLQRKRDEYTNILQMRCNLLQSELETLKRDVARYFYLENLPDDKYTGDIGAEHRLLKEKLSKVGK